jgi:hypothetical protein
MWLKSFQVVKVIAFFGVMNSNFAEKYLFTYRFTKIWSISFASFAESCYQDPICST